MSAVMNQAMQSLDINALLKQVKESLCLSVIQAENRLPEEAFFSLLDGSYVLADAEKGKVVSPFLIEDRQEGVYYPVIFCSFTEEEGKIRLASALPILNHCCLELLEELGIVLSAPFKSEYHRLYDELSEKIEREKVADRIRIVSAYSFFDSSVLMKNRIYDELMVLNQNKEKRVRFQSLINHTTFVKGTGLPTYDDSLFTKISRILDRLQDTSEADVSYDTDELMRYFLLSLMDRTVENRKSLLLALPNDCYQQVRQILKEEYLSDFVFEYTNKLIPYFQSEHIVYDYEEPLEKGSMVCQDFEWIQNQFDDLMTKTSKAFFYPEALVKDVLRMETPFSEIQTIRLDVRDYSKEDYEKDCQFLNHLGSTKGLRESYFLDYPFYGLTCSGKRENYDSLELVVIDLISEIRDFASIASEQESLKEYGWNVETFGEYQELSKNIQVLRGYNGFPKKYFRLNQDNEQKQDLSVLKSLYQACSASRLVVSGFFYENIFVQDIQDLVSHYHGFFGKMKTRNKLKKYLKNKKNQNYDALIRVLDSYCRAQDNLKHVLPSYIEVYGDNVMTMNGVVEIESNIRYIQLFRKRTEELPDFTIDEPFVKKWMNNRNFRNAMDALFVSLDEKYQEIQQSMNFFIGYFLDGPRDFSDVTFDSLSTMLKQKSLLSYDDFREYAQMKKELDESSMTLQLAVRKYENEKKPLVGFVDEYRLSLLKSLFQLGVKRTADFRMESDRIIPKYYSDIQNRQMIHRCARYNRIAHLVVSHCHTAEASEDYQQARRLVLSDLIDEEGLNQIRKTLRNEYPICLIRKEQLYEIKDDEFDTVVLFDSSEFSDEELLSAYQSAEHVLILNEEKKTDKRILSYHDSLLTIKNLYPHLLDFRQDHQPMWNLLKQKFEKLNLTIREDSPYYPCLLESGIAPGCFYALLPNLCVTSHADLVEYKQYRFFLETRNIALFPFDAIGLLLTDEEELCSLKNRIADAIKGGQEGKKE